MASAPRAANDGEVLEPSLELFPFCGSGKGSNDEDFTAPGDWPFDRQCILRLPEDLAHRMTECLQQGSQSRDPPPLDLHLKPETDSRPGRPAGRHWEVRAFGEALNGTLVDLPCHVESHLFPQQESGCIAYKAADIGQMLIVHREKEPPNADRDLDRRTFQWSSGLTPPMKRIRKRKFHGLPLADSEFALNNIPEAVAAIRERLANAPYVYEEFTEVDESVRQEILEKQPDNVWRAPSIPITLRSLTRTASAVSDEGRDGSRVSISIASASGRAASSAAGTNILRIPARSGAASSVISTSSAGSGARSARHATAPVISESVIGGGTNIVDGDAEAEQGPARKRLKLKVG